MFASSDGNNGKGGDWFASVPIFELQNLAVGMLCGSFQMVRWYVFDGSLKKTANDITVVGDEKGSSRREMTGTSSKSRGLQGRSDDE